MRKVLNVIRKRIKRLNNEGSALLTVILVVAFLTILATVLLYVTGMNFQIKQADYQNKKNFYTGETALEQIRTELMKDVSKAALLANDDMAMNYVSLDTEDLRELQYHNYFTSRLQEIWDAKLATHGCWDNLLRSYYTNTTDNTLEMDLAKYDANHNGTLSSVEALDIDSNSGIIYIKGLKMTYTNPDNKLTTIISTDFKITAPAVDWSADSSAQTLPTGVTAVQAGTKELVTPKDSVVYTEWSKE